MADSHQFLEPHPLAMERLPLHDLVLPIKTGTTQEFLDYRKVPRSRGDGMEFSSSDSPELSPRKSSGELASSVPHQLHNQMSQINNINGSVKLRGFLTHDRIDGQRNYDNSKEIKKLSTTSSTEKSVVYNESEGKTSLTKNISELSPTIQDAKLTSSLQPSKAEVPAALHSPFSTRLDQVHNTPLDLSVQVTNQEMTQSTEDSQEEVGSVFKTTVVERGAEFMETHSIIQELEERNSKLVEEKTKLVVQLGVQAKVNAEIKQLLVASVGEDLENRLEALVQQSAQQTVAIEHWKKMSEEYAEESDRLEIECDVWRTKFLASRMLSDELSSWKATLYARHRQAQQALEKILEERAELQQYLRNTRRSLQSLGYTLKYSSNSSTEGILKCKTDSFEQSILEMASINDCLAQEALELSQQVLPSPSLSATALMLTQSMDSKPHQAVEHTPAERLAIQVLTNNVDLQTEEKQDTSCIMKRMGRQYIGHGHRSRLSTNSFRVTFDCCDRCTGPVIVV